MKRKSANEKAIDNVSKASKFIAEPTDEVCAICMNPFENKSPTKVAPEDNRAYQLPNCENHSFHKHCAADALRYNGKCPICGFFYVLKCGTQPENGRMSYTVQNSGKGYELSGYRGVNTIIM